MQLIRSYIILCVLVGLAACKPGTNKQVPVLFDVLKEDRTGLHFNNKLTPAQNFNMFNYMYFYNGAGVAAADFNNDGKVDLFFCSNQGDNKLYLNAGGLRFNDVSAAAAIPQDGGWSTGVSVVDINNDGLLDLYVCRVGNYEVLKSANQLLVCTRITNGIPVYENQAAKYGLDFSCFSTQAAFFDYDMDGDLDMYLLNHSIHQNSSYAPRNTFSSTYDELSGDRMLRNDGTRFTDVTRQSKINSNAIGYGLGIAVSDINLDGWPDMYIGNDFHENDYLYINQHDGTFSEECNQRLMHTSKFTMGVDIADINNDAYPEIISLDMLAADPYILKRSLGDDDHDVFYNKIASGYNYQYSRNNLQLNRKNGMFSEAGFYAGIGATDWSWSPLWMDFNNDGLKDLFIGNGIPKRLNDMDYINFIYNSEVQQKIQNKQLSDKDLDLTKKFPEIKIRNKFFTNTGNLRFSDEAAAIGNDQVTYSNGAVYADFDNDGDLDVVVNNIDDAALLYENKLIHPAKNSVNIQLKGPIGNSRAVGARLFVFSGDAVKTYEKNPVRGFMSSMEIPLHVGLGSGTADSALLVWPDNSFQSIRLQADSMVEFVYQKGLPAFDFGMIRKFGQAQQPVFENITAATALQYQHRENTFNDFDREPLMPHMISAEGPAIAIADINHDGLDDLFAGASKTFQKAVYLQQANGSFIKTNQPSLRLDSMYEDVDATWSDVNRDGHPDLVVATGGNEYFGKDQHLQPRVYLNDGKGNLEKLPHAFKDIYLTASCVTAMDINGDGMDELFFGGRAVSWNYGAVPASYLLQNDGTGRFLNATESLAPGLSDVGMVTDAVWVDIDKDNDQDLLVTCEWGGIAAFVNNAGKFVKKEITDKKGWWNFLLPVDIDNDGDTDFIAGNLGVNSRLKASAEQPVCMYYNDFDDNGKMEQVVTYYVGGREVTFASKEELEKQIPILKKRFFYAEDFAKAKLQEIFTSQKIDDAVKYTANYFSNAVLINNGSLSFNTVALPWQAQLSSCRTASIVGKTKEGKPRILAAGNFYGSSVHSGRYDADFGSLISMNQNGVLEYEQLTPILLKGEVRHIEPIRIGKRQAFVIAKNNDSLLVIAP